MRRGALLKVFLPAALLAVWGGQAFAGPRLAGEDLAAALRLYAEGVAEQQSLFTACPPADPAQAMTGWDDGVKLLNTSLANAGLPDGVAEDVAKRLERAGDRPAMACTDPSVQSRLGMAGGGANWKDIHRTALRDFGIAVVEATPESEAVLAKVKAVFDEHGPLEGMALRCMAVLQPAMIPVYAGDWSEQVEKAEAHLKDSGLPPDGWEPLVQLVKPARLLEIDGSRGEFAKKCLADDGWTKYFYALKFIGFAPDVAKALGKAE